MSTHKAPLLSYLPGLRVNAFSDVIHKDDCHHVGKHATRLVGLFASDRACSHCRPELPR